MTAKTRMTQSNWFRSKVVCGLDRGSYVYVVCQDGGFKSLYIRHVLLSCKALFCVLRPWFTQNEIASLHCFSEGRNVPL